MKKFNALLFTAIAVFSFHISQAQLCNSANKGPNLLGAKGTFSAPFITVNNNAAPCLSAGDKTYNPAGNIGNALTGCTVDLGDIQPCSDYNYTAAENGMQPEFTYSIVKVMGDNSGSNCLHSPIWQARNHTNSAQQSTGDGGYFMAVNGAPNKGYSPIFYKIKKIPVCIGTTYEFSAWVINMMPPGGKTSDAPNISFVVNGNVIGTSGPIPYDREWHQVGGQYTPTLADISDPQNPTVDLQVINATSVAGGNDLGLDDISFRVCESRIDVSGPATVTVGSPATASFTVTDPLDQNIWWKVQFSSDGGSNFTDVTTGEIATFTNHNYTIDYKIFGGIAAYPQWNGFQFRLLASTSKLGLDNPDCRYVNEFRLIITDEQGGPTPVTLSAFNGTYSRGVATINWKTSQEINNDHFELYRSFDGNNFSLAATVAGKGNSSVVSNYSYNDQIPAQGNNVFYKLKQVDKDGRFVFSDVIKISLADANASFRISPNPVVNNFAASFNSPKAGTATLLIRNTEGQVVVRKKVDVTTGNNTLQVNTVQLSSGIYYVSLINGDVNYNAKLQKL